jgi:hypothetical protein
MHRRLWLNDPDCVMLRSSETRLSREERFALASAVAISGGMLLVSDDMKLLDAESGKLFRLIADIGMDVDNASRNEPPIAKSLMLDTTIHALIARGSRKAMHLLLNTSDITQEASVSAIPEPRGPEKLIGPDHEEVAPEKIELPAHSARIIHFDLA